VINKVTATLKFECLGHSGPIYTICNGINETTFFTGGSDRVIATWSSESGKQTGLTIKTDAPIFSLCIIPENNLLCVGLNTGSIHIIDLVSKKEIRNLKFHSSSVFEIVYDSDKKLIYSCDASGNLAVFNSENFTLLATFPFGDFRIRNIYLKNNLLYLCRGDGQISILETQNFNEVLLINAHENGCNTVLVSDDNIIYSGGKDAWLKKWIENKYQHGWPAHKSGIYDLKFIHNNQVLVSASRDKTIKFWNPKTLDPLLRVERKTHKSHTHSVNKLIWQQQTKLLWSVGDDKRILGWDMSIS
jgi:WD40 repeat protein